MHILEAEDDDSSTYTPPCYPWGRRGGGLGSQQLHPALAIVSTGGMNHQVENHSMSLSLSLSLTKPLNEIRICKKETNFPLLNYCVSICYGRIE